MTTTGWEHSSRARDAPTTCRGHILRVVGKRQGPRNQGIWLPGQPPSTWGPPGGPGAPPWGPRAPHPLMSPGFDRRGQMAVSARRGQMTAFAWFLRPLTEWPGFPTLLYSVIQLYTVHSCSSSAWGMFFHRNIILGKHNTFIISIIIIEFFKVKPPRPTIIRIIIIEFKVKPKPPL